MQQLLPRASCAVLLLLSQTFDKLFPIGDDSRPVPNGSSRIPSLVFGWLFANWAIILALFVGALLIWWVLSKPYNSWPLPRPYISPEELVEKVAIGSIVAIVSSIVLYLLGIRDGITLASFSVLGGAIVIAISVLS